MPDNDKIQLPKGFKLDELDESIETPNVKLPKGFTLDTEVVKKKVGGEESSLTKSQLALPDFEKGKAFAEKGFLMQPEGTKSPKEVKVEPVEKQGWLLNTVSALDKGFAKNFISSPIKGLGTVLQGATKKALGGTGEGIISDNLIKLGDYLNNAIDELTPQDEEFKGSLTDQVAQAFGQVGSLIATGGIAGAAGKGAALVSQAPKASAAATAVKTLGSQLASPTAVSAGLSMGQAEFDRAKQEGANDDQAFEAFYKNAAVGSVLETIPVMQFFKRFNNTTGGSVANYIKTKGVAGLTGGIEEMTTEVLQQIYSNKTAKDIYNINQDILDGVGTSGGIGFGVGFLLNAMGANAKILRKEGKQKEADVLENQIKQYEDNLENPKVTSGNKVSAKDIVTQGVEIGTQKAVKNLDRDLANNVITPEQYEEGIVFAEKAAQVADKIPETVTGESRAKSIELLVERNDINQANQNLLQQKQNTDVAYHAGIDEEIKANEERIKKLDSEVYNIAKKPSKEFGGKKYIVDGEEVSQAEFEALEGKPVGTKEIIKAEIKPAPEVSDIEKRRKEELASVPGLSLDMTKEENQKLIDKTNEIVAKYDAELAALESVKPAEEAPRFPSYDDAQEWIKSKSKEYKSKNEFLASQEYKDALPDINALFKVEKADYSKKAKSAMQESGVKIGDRVIYDYVTPIGVETYSGQIVDRQGVPFVRFDNGQKTISGKQSVRWHKGFIKEPAPESVVEQIKPTEVKEKGKAAKVAQPELAPIEEKKESFTTKSGRQKVAYEKGQLIVRDAKTGKEVSPSTRKKALDEYIDKFDFSKGKTVEELDIELPNNLSEEEGKIFIADNSSNPLELAMLHSSEPKEMKLSGKEQMIAEFGIGTVDQKSFGAEIDKNFITGGMAFSYFRKGGMTLDGIASEMSRHYGVEITPEDIGNFMINHPRGSDAALREGESRVAQRAAERFKELTGLNLDNTLANKIIDAEMAKAEAFEQELIKQEYETREQLEADYWKASEEADRLAEESNRPTTKESEKTPKTEERLAKEYKEVVGKASKKAKENAKKEFVDRNFDNIVEKLKIQIKCPT